RGAAQRHARAARPRGTETVTAVAARNGEGAPSPAQAAAAPRWLQVIDSATIVLINLALITEVTIVFLNTVLRNAVNGTLLPGVEETSRLFLIITAFLGGAVAYGRGRFMAVNYFVERLDPAWRDFFAAAVAWMIILITGVIGAFAVPLYFANAGERSTMLGIPYIVMTAPVVLGCALFVAHAGVALSRRPARAIVLSAFAVAAIAAAFMATRNGAWVDSGWFYAVLAAVFFLQLGIGLPVGFVLATVGFVYVYSTAAAPLIAVPMNAQRGVGGFIFLALPFFIL